MSAAGLVLVPVQGAMVVNFQQASILDSATVEAIAKDLYALVDERAIKKIVLDLQSVKFLASQMLGVLMSMHKKSQAINGRVILCGVRPELLKIFKVMSLQKVLQIKPNEEQALREFDIFTHP